MCISALSRLTVAVASTLIMASMAQPVQAAETAENSGSLYPSLSLTPAVRDKLIWRVQYVHAFTRTKSKPARDVTGPVVTIADLTAMANALPNGNRTGTTEERLQYRKKQDYILAGINAIGMLDDALVADYGYAAGAGGLGTPGGILAKAGDASTLALSAGYYLDDNYSWLMEALVLGAPLTINVTGAGVNDAGGSNALVGKKILDTKMLPPMLLLTRQFGSRESTFRPFVGIGAMYALFFDSKSTDALDAYQGGKTSVSIKNSFGAGPFVGFQYQSKSGWFAGLNVGYVPLKTEATLVTRNTAITTLSGVLKDYGPNTVEAIEAAEITFGTNTAGGQPVYPHGFTTELMKDLAAYKGGSLGNYVRKQSSTIYNTIVMLSVGCNF